MKSMTDQSENVSWPIFRGDKTERRLAEMPDPPPWRKPPGTVQRAGEYDNMRKDLTPVTLQRGRAYETTPQIVQMVNAALYLRRPLLITGAPGTGKSSLIDAITVELGLGEPLRWPVNSRSTLREGLYNYDAIGRAQYRFKTDGDHEELKDEDFLELGPLGTALVPAIRPRPLLIDEMDKADVDLANDLLHVLEEGQFTIQELSRMPGKSYRIRTFGSVEKFEVFKGRVERFEFPLLIITSNGERGFPAAFLRRCLQIKMPDVGRDVHRLTRIVKAHLGEDISVQAKAVIENFVHKADSGETVATDQLLNAIQLVYGGYGVGDAERDDVIARLMISLSGSAQ